MVAFASARCGWRGVVDSGATHTPDALRQVGLLYELVGVLAVVIEIRKTRHRNKLDPLHVRFLRYVLAVPFFRHSQTVIAGGIASTAAFGDSAAISGSVALSPPTVDQRLALLEGRAAALEAQQAALRRDFKAEVKRASEGLKQEAADREAAVAALHAEIKEVATGGLDLSLFGVAWLLIGMVMTTATLELCRWVLRCS